MSQAIIEQIIIGFAEFTLPVVLTCFVIGFVFDMLKP